jgi:hypothetical protein
LEDGISKKYSTYNTSQLEQVLRDIDRDKYPERVLIAEMELAKKIGFNNYDEYKEFTKNGFRAVIDYAQYPSKKILLNLDWSEYFPSIILKLLSIIVFAYYINYKLFVYDLHIISNTYMIMFFITIAFVSIIKSIFYFLENKNSFYELKGESIIICKNEDIFIYNLSEIKDVIIMKPYFFEIFKIKFNDDELKINILTPNYKELKLSLLDFLKKKIKNHDLILDEIST